MTLKKDVSQIVGVECMVVYINIEGLPQSTNHYGLVQYHLNIFA